MYLCFLDSDETYPIENGIEYFGSDKLCIYQSNIPENTSGFDVVDDDGTITSFHNYNTIYSVSKKQTNDDDREEYIIFTSDATIRNVYYVYDENGFVTGYISSVKEINESNTIWVRSGVGSYYENVPLEELLDDDNIPLHKIDNGKIIDTTEEDRVFLKEKKIQDAKDEKISELSMICENIITNGIEYNEEHFSYKLSDQNNISNSVQLAKGTGLDIPYHADGKKCRLFSKEEIISIYILAETNLTHNTTYYNQLKEYVKSLESVDDIQGVYYGQELIGEYLDNYNTIVEHTQKIINAFVGDST